MTNLIRFILVLLACHQPLTSSGQTYRHFSSHATPNNPGLVILYRKDHTPFFPPSHYAKGDSHDVPIYHDRSFSKSITVSGTHSHPRIVPHDAPSCAGDRTFCLYNHEYPVDEVEAIIDRFYNDVYEIYSSLNTHFSPSDFAYFDNHTYSYHKHGHFVCPSETTYLRPGWARNWKGHWLAVINTDKFPQTVRVEHCKFPHKSCEYLPPCYESTCKQRYSLIQLLCVDPYNYDHKPIVDLFALPTGCSCFVEDFIYSKHEL